MAEIHVMPGIERRDLTHPLPAEQLLQKAIEAGVTDVTIVARGRSGQPYIASCVQDMDKTVGMLMKAVHTIAGATIINDQVIDTESEDHAG